MNVTFIIYYISKRQDKIQGTTDTRENLIPYCKLHCLPSLCLQTYVSLFENTLHRRLAICFLVSQSPFKNSVISQ